MDQRLALSGTRCSVRELQSAVIPLWLGPVPSISSSKQLEAAPHLDLSFNCFSSQGPAIPVRRTFAVASENIHAKSLKSLVHVRHWAGLILEVFGGSEQLAFFPDDKLRLH